MNAKVLDKRTDGNSSCYLCRINLQEYIEALPPDYKEYDVQREIVSNEYLDNIIDTVLNKRHIPPIVLIANKLTKHGDTINIYDFKILDGLQRTYRLNAIWRTVRFFINESAINSNITNYSRLKLSKEYSRDLIAIDSNTKILSSIIEFQKSNNAAILSGGFSDNYQWFEVWTGLTPEEEVNKMLILNAGHKPVKLRHQLELIFRNILPDLKAASPNGFEIIREKEKNSTQFNKSREVGQFHFSQIISSILSLKDGQPVTTNTAFIQKLNTDYDTETNYEVFNYSFFKLLTEFLAEMDILISKKYGEEGLRWFGREVTLVGMFGALGSYVGEENISFPEGMKYLNVTLSRNISSLNLPQFEIMRNNMDLGKVNIGKVNKNAIYDAIKDLLKEKTQHKIDWAKYFGND